MQDSRVLVTLTLIFGLLSSLQGVNTNETVNTCDILNCSRGFRCCDNECCLEREVRNSENEPFWIVFTDVCSILLVFCICGLALHRELQHEFRTVDHQTPPEPPSIAPLEITFNTSLDPEPPYFEVVLTPTSTESSPPSSLRTQGPAVQMRGTL